MYFLFVMSVLGGLGGRNGSIEAALPADRNPNREVPDTMFRSEALSVEELLGIRLLVCMCQLGPKSW